MPQSSLLLRTSWLNVLAVAVGSVTLSYRHHFCHIRTGNAAFCKMKAFKKNQVGREMP